MQSTPAPKLLDQVRMACRLRHLSPKTEKAYVQWFQRFVFYHDKQHPRTLREAHIRAYLTYILKRGHHVCSPLDA